MYRIIVMGLVSLFWIVLLCTVFYNLLKAGVMYRINVRFRAKGRINGKPAFPEGLICSQQCPFKWLAIYKAKRWIKNDPKVYEANVEDISDGVFDYATCSGKIVWKWDECFCN